MFLNSSNIESVKSMNEKTDQSNNSDIPKKSPLLTGLAVLSVVLLIVVLVQSSRVSRLNEENNALSDRISVLEEELRVSQESLATLQQKEPNLFESLIGSMKELVGEAGENIDGQSSQSAEQITESNSDTSSEADY